MKILYILPLVWMLVFTSCNSDFLDREPSNKYTDDMLLTSTEGGMMLLNGTLRRTYISYESHAQYGQKAVDIMTDMLGEDYYTGDGYWNNYESWYSWLAHRSANDEDNKFVWMYYYGTIDNMNLLLAHVDAMKGEQKERDNLKGQAYAFRAHSYFKLVQLYAERYKPEGRNTQLGIPVYTHPTSEGKARSTVEEVYTRINTDLDSAMMLLTEGRIHISHFNLNVAQGIKAEVLLTMGKYKEAAKMAHEARQGFGLMPQELFAAGFNSVNNPEWMWGMQIKVDQSTIYASYFSNTDPCSVGYNELGNEKRINSQLYDAMNDSDVRKSVCVGADGATLDSDNGEFIVPPYTVNKFRLPSYTNWSGDYCYMRAAEMYLIEAEGLARSDQSKEAAKVLYELVSARDPKYKLPDVTGNALVEEVMLQRRLELLGEGFRFMDMKRLNLSLDRTDKGHEETFLKPAKVDAGDIRWQFLIPTQEMTSNPNMVQND